MQKNPKLAPAEERLQLNRLNQLTGVGLSTFGSPLGNHHLVVWHPPRSHFLAFQCLPSTPAAWCMPSGERKDGSALVLAQWSYFEETNNSNSPPEWNNFHPI